MWVAGAEDGVDGAAGGGAGVGGIERKGAAERGHDLVHGAALPFFAEHLRHVGAVMLGAVDALGAGVLDLPGHQLLGVVGALGRGEFGDRGIAAAGGDVLPVKQQCALAGGGDAFGGGGLELHRGLRELPIVIRVRSPRAPHPPRI